MKSDDKLMKPRRTAAETLAAILDHVALDETDDPEPTEADRQWAHEQHALMQGHIAAMRRQHMPKHPVIQRAPTPSAELRALTHVELLARLERLSQGGAVQFAHRKLTGLTDDDLRQMLAVLEAPDE